MLRSILKLLTGKPTDILPRAYPVEAAGLPIVSSSSIVDSQAGLISNIKSVARAPGEAFDSFYMDGIRRYASLVHLLPASEAYHHCGSGGLFRHGLETALYALQVSEAFMFGKDIMPSQRKKLVPKWELAVFLAALSHDIGKVASDVFVQVRDESWRPFGVSIEEWGAQVGATSYEVSWIGGRHKKHESLGPLLIGKIISDDALSFLHNPYVNLLWMILDAVGAESGEINIIADIIEKADMLSVKEDLRFNRGGGALSNRQAASPGVVIQNVIRTIIKDREWSVNEKGLRGRAWYVDDILHLVWPGAGEDIIQSARRLGVESLPGDVDSILTLMKSFDLVFEEDGVSVFDLKVDDKTTLKAIQLNNPGFYFEILPQSLASNIAPNDPEEIESTSENSGVQGGSKPAPPAPHVDPLKQPEVSSPPSIVTPQAPREETSTKGVKVEIPQPASLQPPPSAISSKPPREFFESKELGGEILLSVAERIQSGALVEKKHFVVQAGKPVVFVFPSAVEGLGFKPKELLELLLASGLIAGLTSAEAVSEHQGFGKNGREFRRAFALTKEAAAALQGVLAESNQRPKSVDYNGKEVEEGSPQTSTPDVETRNIEKEKHPSSKTSNALAGLDANIMRQLTRDFADAIIRSDADYVFFNKASLAQIVSSKLNISKFSVLRALSDSELIELNDQSNSLIYKVAVQHTKEEPCEI